jgi:hypothetical protein
MAAPSPSLPPPLPPLPPPPPIASPIPDLNSLPSLNLYLIRLVSHLQTDLYDGSFLSVIPESPFKTNDYTFFITGGYAASFYIPQIISMKDIDCSVLINPSLSDEHKYKLYFHLYMFLIHKLVYWIKTTSSFWPSIFFEYQQKGFLFEDLTVPQRLHIRQNGFTSNNINPHHNLLTNLDVLYNSEETVLPPGCPFRVEILTDNTFDGTKLNMLILSVKLRIARPPRPSVADGRGSSVSLATGTSTPSVAERKIETPYNHSYLDISISKSSKLTNEYDFDLGFTGTIKHAHVDALTQVPLFVANPVYLYINQVASSQTNTRPQKVSARIQRARLLLDYILHSYSTNTNNIKYDMTFFAKWFYEHSNLLYYEDFRYYDYEQIFNSLRDMIENPRKINTYFARGGYKSKVKRKSITKSLKHRTVKRSSKTSKKRQL